MDTKSLQTKTENIISSVDRRQDIEYINDTFKLKDTVEHLRFMMKDVTKTEVNARTVNAACNCIQQLNQTIDTVIKAARFLRER